MILNIKNAARSQIPEITDIFDAYSLENIYNNEYFDECIAHSLLTAVIVCDKTVRGVCICNTSQIPDSCEIELLYISKDYKNKGFGRKLLSYALREMRAKRYKKAFLWVNEANKEAIDFFCKFGFLTDNKQRRDKLSNVESYQRRYRIDI